MRHTLGEGLLSCLRSSAAALGVIAASIASAHAADPASTEGNWSEFGFVAHGGRFNPAEHILNATNVAALKVLWSTSDGSFPLTALAVVNGVVYSGTNAIEAATGKLLWATNSFGISPAVSKGTVYIDSFSGLCAYAAAGGTNLWCAGTNYLPDAPSGAAVVDGIAYFGSAVGSVFAIDAKTGAKLWSSSILGSVNTSSPAVVGGVVYAGGRVVAAFNATTGAVLWSVSPGGPLSIPGDSPAVAKGIAYIGASVTGLHGSSSGTLYALNASTGKTVWSAPVASGVTSSPCVANGVVYVGSDDGTLYAFNAKTGVELVAVAGVAGQSSPTVANGVVYSETTESGELFALGLGAIESGRANAP